MRSVAAILIVMLLNTLIGGGLILIDRKRLAAQGKRYGGWYPATLWIAVSGLWIPTPFAFGAHVWVSREGPVAKRFVQALAATAIALLAWELAAQLLLTQLDLPLEVLSVRLSLRQLSTGKEQT